MLVWQLLGWQKSSFRFFCKMVWKNPYKLFGQPNTFCGLSRWLSGKESTCQAEDTGWMLGLEDPLEKEVATHSSILVWEIPWIEEPAGHSPWGHKESDTTW